MTDEAALIAETRSIYLQDAVDDFNNELDALLELCESPIERVFFAALFVQCKADEYPYPRVHWMQKPRENVLGEPYFSGVFGYIQQPIGDYRVDFVVANHELTPPRFVVIECDGHDFHERTKEQARRDRQRDRFLQSAGFKVLRFTGSEIWADASNCAFEVREAICI